MTNIIGVDEAGRGPLLGRVYAGAVIYNDIIDNQYINNIITDSKKLTKKKRKVAYDYIIDNMMYGAGYATEQEIDNFNILNATKMAMERAIDNIIKKYNIDNYKLLIDGCYWERYFDNCTSIVKGDSKFKCISAASIIAKESHDNYIQDLCNNNSELNERYDLLKNMGYGTKKHIDGIMKYGISNFHRKTFKQCK
jgi:ribonuclease HII